MRAVGRAIAKVLGLIDEIVTVLIAAAGIALAVALALDGATVLQVALVLVLTAAVAARWASTSNARDWFKRS